MGGPMSALILYRIVRNMKFLMRFTLRWWAPLLAVAIAMVGVCLTYYLWAWLTENGGDSPSAAIRNAGLVIAAPVALVLAVWRSIVAQEQAGIARLSLQEGRYQKAADMLGSNLLSVRLGGIYVLCHLARNYPVEFHIQVTRLLSAFVRHPPVQELKEMSGITEGGYNMPSVPREEVQVILVFFGERSAQGRGIEKEQCYALDLQGSDLRGIWLSPGACLDGVRVRGANLSGATLSGVRGLTERQLFEAEAEPHNPPKLINTNDCETGKPLIWPAGV